MLLDIHLFFIKCFPFSYCFPICTSSILIMDGITNYLGLNDREDRGNTFLGMLSAECSSMPSIPTLIPRIPPGGGCSQRHCWLFHHKTALERREAASPGIAQGRHLAGIKQKGHCGEEFKEKQCVASKRLQRIFSLNSHFLMNLSGWWIEPRVLSTDNNALKLTWFRSRLGQWP